MLLSYEIAIAQDEVAKADFFGFSAWWADVCQWWSNQIILFSRYLDWIVMIGCVVMLLLYAVTRDKKIANKVIIIVIVWVCWKAAWSVL